MNLHIKAKSVAIHLKSPSPVKSIFTANLPAFFFKILFIYLKERERAYKQVEQQAEGEGEAGFLLSRDPEAGLHPKTPGRDLS